MIEEETVRERLQALSEYTAKLRKLQRFSSQDLLDDLEKLWAVEHGLQLASECILDIGSHVIVEEKLGRPKDYTEIIIILGQSGVIPQEFADEIKGIAGFRNILIHEYLRVDPIKVYKNLQKGADQFDQFAGYIKNFLEKS